MLILFKTFAPVPATFLSIAALLSFLTILHEWENLGKGRILYSSYHAIMIGSERIRHENGKMLEATLHAPDYFYDLKCAWSNNYIQIMLGKMALM